LNVLHLSGRASLRIEVLRAGVPQEGRHDFGQAQSIAGRAGSSAAPDEPFGDDPVILAPTGFRAMWTEVDVAAVDRNDGPSTGFVESIGRGPVGSPYPRNPVITGIPRFSEPHYPPRADNGSPFGRIG
jgi:hypothetical protein